MKRRDFISILGAGAAVASTPALGNSWFDSFHKNVQAQPWMNAFKTVNQESFNSTAVGIRGKMPTDLRGNLYRNGPARHEIGDFRYKHWFAGDGMVQSYQFTDVGIQHQAKMIETKKYVAERQQGRALYSGFASTPPNPAPVTSPDSVNVANISVLPHNGKLFALWEAGSPWEMDPDTLETKGLYAYSRETRGLPFSAHPRVEPDGTIWNFGYASAAKKLIFWHINATGVLVKVGAVPCDPISMPHDFLVTEKHIAIMISPFHYEGGSDSFLDAHQWHPDQLTKLLVIDKHDFGNPRWFELPAQWVFHFSNAYEENNVIHFEGARAPDPLEMTERIPALMQGTVDRGHGESRLFHYQIDLNKGRASEVVLFGPELQSEFPAVDPRVSCRRHHRTVMMTTDRNQPPASHPMLNAVSVYDDRKSDIDTFVYPDSHMPEEHLFIPAPNSQPETQGWVVGTAVNYKKQRTELSVFDIRGVSDGPIYTAELPYMLPLGLHGKFVQSS